MRSSRCYIILLELDCNLSSTSDKMFKVDIKFLVRTWLFTWHWLKRYGCLQPAVCSGGSHCKALELTSVSNKILRISLEQGKWYQWSLIIIYTYLPYIGWKCMDVTDQTSTLDLATVMQRNFRMSRNWHWAISQKKFQILYYEICFQSKMSHGMKLYQECYKYILGHHSTE
jgi:hypothetical protein